jgi:hypothetical protein
VDIGDSIVWKSTIDQYEQPIYTSIAANRRENESRQRYIRDSRDGGRRADIWGLVIVLYDNGDTFQWRLGSIFKFESAGGSQTGTCTSAAEHCAAGCRCSDSRASAGGNSTGRQNNSSANLFFRLWRCCGINAANRTGANPSPYDWPIGPYANYGQFYERCQHECPSRSKIYRQCKWDCDGDAAGRDPKFHVAPTSRCSVWVPNTEYTTGRPSAAGLYSATNDHVGSITALRFFGNRKYNAGCHVEPNAIKAATSFGINVVRLHVFDKRIRHGANLPKWTIDFDRDGTECRTAIWLPNTERTRGRLSAAGLVGATNDHVGSITALRFFGHRKYDCCSDAFVGGSEYKLWNCKRSRGEQICQQRKWDRDGDTS